MKKNYLLILIVLLFALGCRAAPAPDAGFISDPSRMGYDKDLPFNRVWYDKGVDWDSYNKVVVAPVNITYLLEMDWWQKSSLAGNDQNANEIATYLRQQIIKAFEKQDSENRFQVVSQRGPNTLVLELALIEVTPTKAWLNAASLMFVGALDTGTAAIEGRMRDGSTGEVIYLLADRQMGKASLVSAKDFTWWSHAKAVCNEWAKIMVKELNAKVGERVKPQATFTLKPW